ncbi:NAD(P)H-binding protein [Rhizobium leguminosarum]|uniref:NAD(P)H-binding protein n=1 Tax=Rhizobium leguminosarum TaxID=384 RepID=UPI001C9695DF|nr:NAD(P)H-binding protein [Rhizobium leguminosarum]MBY5591589.1 NAD(P)H-binding protein [Rhizobium leguminosarum]MBY5605425.1 NAD(P)H-binding protein [Rhizobium leguminosarum]
MTKILILGANGRLARNTTRFFLETTDVELKLFLRQAKRLQNPDPSRVEIVEGDVNDMAGLRRAIAGCDVVYANLSGDMARQAESIVAAMHDAGLRRIVFVSSMGIYGEVPGETYHSILDPYRDSAAFIEKSDLDYTILRPGWFTQDRKVSYQLTRKGEPFVGHDVSLDSLSDIIVKLSLDPGLHVRQSLGVSSR